MPHEFNIATSTHFEYQTNEDNWLLWRNVKEGGRNFIEQYVEKISSFEQPGDFARRKRMTPIAAFARAGVIDIKNAIFQRMDAIHRNGGSKSYQDAVTGKFGGVDLRGSTMDHFLGMEVLEELLFMGKIGVFVDSPQLPIRRTLAQRGDEHPYIYPVIAEDIRNWRFFLRKDRLEFESLLLRIRRDKIDNEFGFADDFVDEFWSFHVGEFGDVLVRFFDFEGTFIEEASLEIDRIPFALIELSQSLVKDIANHQILLTNLESMDGNYALRSNVPFLVKKYDPMMDPEWLGGGEEPITDPDGEDDPTRGGDNPEVLKIGSHDGLKVPKGVEYPIFIHPSSEPLAISMEKQKNLKDDIRTLLNLAISNVRPKFASAESKILDERGLDAGLSAIGLVLEHAEREIAQIWSLYDGGEPASIKYPEKYSLRSDADRRADAQLLDQLADAFVSKTASKVVEKEKAEILFAGKISDEDLKKIKREIDESPWPTAKADIIRSDTEMGYVSREGGSLARGYPAGEAEKAAGERAERDAAMAMAQGVNLAARGIVNDPEAAAAEKDASQNPENNPDGIRRVRQ